MIIKVVKLLHFFWAGSLSLGLRLFLWHVQEQFSFRNRSIYYVVSSPLLQGLFHVLFRRNYPAAVPDIERSRWEKTSSNTDGDSILVRQTGHTLVVFTLSLCFAFASVAGFASLLSFPGGSTASCGTSACHSTQRFGLKLGASFHSRMGGHGSSVG